MTIGGSTTLLFSGRGTHTVTSAGRQLTQAIQITAPGGTYTLQDAFSAVENITVNNGELISNNFSVGSNTLISNNSNTRAITCGTSTWTFTSTSSGANLINFTTITNFTLSAASATFNVSGVTTNGRNFRTGGLTVGTINYTLSGSTGTLTIFNGGTYGTLNFSDGANARTLKFQNGQTYTFTNAFNVNGGSGRLITIDTDSAGNAATLSKSSGTVSCDYLSIQDSTATGGATWYAGANSTSVSGNSGWNFSSPPSGSSGGGGAPGTTSLQSLLNLMSL
jgi:hypothetical protein